MYTISDLLEARSDIESYIIIFESMIYDSDLPPSEAYKKYNSEHSSESYGTQIINLIIDYDRSDVLERLYQNNVCDNYFLEMIEFALREGKTNCSDIILKYYSDQEFNVYVIKNILNDKNNMIDYLLEKGLTNKKLILSIIQSAIIINNNDILKTIYENMDNYKITQDDFNTEILNLYKIMCTRPTQNILFTGEKINSLKSYGFDIEPHLDELFIRTIKKNNIEAMQLFIKMGVDANHIINNLK